MFDGDQVLRSRTVVVSESRIAAVTHRSAARGAQIVEGRGRTLLPGVIDAHVHLGLVRARHVLAGGVTAARDLGWPERKVFPAARHLAGDPAAGPLLLAAGPMLTAPGGYPSRARWGPRGTAREVASPEEAVAAVRRLVTAGAAVIKVAQEPRAGPTLPPAVLAAIVGEAHREGLMVTTHLGSLDQLEVALASGVDELAHGLWSNEEIPGPTIDEMVRAGMVVVPTLHIDPAPARLGNLRRFVEAGGRVVYGTDMGNAGPPEGIDVRELVLMVEAGMTPGAALAAATSGAASHLGLAGRGTVIQGAVADLLLVDGDPLTDLSVLSRPVLVMREGRVVR